MPNEDISGIDDLLSPSVSFCFNLFHFCGFEGTDWPLSSCQQSFANASTSGMVMKPKRPKKIEKREWAHVVDVNKELVNVSSASLHPRTDDSLTTVRHVDSNSLTSWYLIWPTK